MFSDLMQLTTAANHMVRQGVASSVDVRVLPSSAAYNRFWWLVRRVDGQILASSPHTYSSEVEARNAADVAAGLLLGHRARSGADENVDEVFAQEIVPRVNQDDIKSIRMREPGPARDSRE
jgi:hypothetical protein